MDEKHREFQQCVYLATISSAIKIAIVEFLC